MERQQRFSFIVGSIFLALLAGVIVLGATLLRDAGALRQRMRIEVAFADVSGLRPGAPVRLSGWEVGVVDEVRVDPRSARHLVTLSIVDQPAYRHWIRRDSKFQILADNLLGNKHVAISFGSTGTPLENGARVEGASPVGIEAILVDLRETVANTAGLTKRLGAALAVADGEGGGLGQTLVRLQQSLEDTGVVTRELKSLFARDSRDPDSLRATLGELRRASENAAKLAEELKLALKGPDGKPRDLGAVLTNLERTAANAQQVSDDMKKMLGGGKNGKPADVGKTLRDLEIAAENLKEITASTKSMIEVMRKVYPPNWFK